MTLNDTESRTVETVTDAIPDTSSMSDSALAEAARKVADNPEVQDALQAARVAELSQPTLAEGETYNELLKDRGAFEDFDIDRARTQGYGFARVQRLAIEHLLGTR